MAKQATAAAVRPGPFARLRDYLIGVRVELEKVTWPSKEDLKASTTVVIFFLALLAVMIGAMDLVFQRVVLLLFGLV